MNEQLNIPPASKDEQMDEFEIVPGKVGTQKNQIKFSKQIVAISVICIMLVVGSIIAMVILQSMPTPGNPIVLVPDPTITPTITPTQSKNLPTEYMQLDEKINNYKSKFDQTPTQRTQMNIPSMNFETSLKE